MDGFECGLELLHTVIHRPRQVSDLRDMVVPLSKGGIRMGARSNVNFITARQSISVPGGEVEQIIGLNVYLHWGCVEALILALETAAIEEVFGRRHDSYFVGLVAAAIAPCGGMLGAALEPFVDTTEVSAYAHIQDNSFMVLAFDQTKQVVALTWPSFGGGAVEVVGRFPLTKDGLARCRAVLMEHYEVTEEALKIGHP